MRVCLIHGSTQGPHGWDLLVKELMAWGVEVTAVDLPRVAEGAEYFAREVAAQVPGGEPPVVVAHSLAGLVLPYVPLFMEVARLVYLTAVIPRPGAALSGGASGEMFQPEWRGKDPTSDFALARHFLFHDCDPRVQEWALTTLRLWSSPVLVSEVCTLGVLPPATYVSASLDRALNPEWWEREAARSGFEVVRMETGHAPHVSSPRELARVVMAS